MERREVGRTGVSVTTLGFGGVGLGQRIAAIDEAQAEATMRAALDAGIAYFDTSPWYGHGLSEHRVGYVLRTRPRDDFVLSTKVGRVFFRPDDPDGYRTPTWCDGLPFDYRFDYTADGIRRSYEDSLHRLGLNRVDLLFVHDIDPRHLGEGVDDALDALDGGGGWKVLADMRSRGEIRGIGFGVNHMGMIPRFLERFDPDLFLIAMPYTLLDQEALDGELPACTARGIGVVIGSVFSSGITATGAGAGAVYRYRPPSDAVVAKLRRIEAVCAAHGTSVRAAALQFPLFHPAVAAIIPGAMTPEHVRENAALLRRPVPPALWAELKAEGLLREDAPTG